MHSAIVLHKGQMIRFRQYPEITIIICFPLVIVNNADCKLILEPQRPHATQYLRATMLMIDTIELEQCFHDVRVNIAFREKKVYSFCHYV